MSLSDARRKLWETYYRRGLSKEVYKKILEQDNKAAELLKKKMKYANNWEERIKLINEIMGEKK